MAKEIKKKSRLAVFVSGSGTNMENLINVAKANRLENADIVLVISDRPGVAAIAKAQKAGVSVAVVDRKQFADKAAFEEAIIDHLETEKIEWIVLAGFMRLLSPEFVRRYAGKIINVHPSLLPAFPGAHSIKDAFDAKVKETGVTVHFVDEGVDTGPVILQGKVPVEANDTLEILEARVHQLEYRIYPEALRMVLTGKIRLPGHHREDEAWEKD